MTREQSHTLTPEQLKAIISEQQAEIEKLKLESNYFRSLLNNTPNMSFIFSDLGVEDPKVVEFSKGAEKLLGYKRDEVIGKSISMFHLPEEIQKFPEVSQKMAEGQLGFSGETVLLRKNEEQFPALFSTYPVYNDKNELIGGLGISLDISDRKEMEDELKKANIAQDKFFSIIAHDLKSPFNSIIGFSNLLCDEDEEFDNDELLDIATVINTTAKNAYELLTNLLEWTRAQSGMLKFLPVKFNLTELIRDTVDMFESIADTKDIQLSFRTRKPYYCFADRNMVYTIVRNLLNNSIKFTNIEGKVTLTIKEQKDNIRLSVADNGVGIEAGKIDTLFSEDLNKSTKGTNKEKGSGLGLLLCKEFAERNKGSIEVESMLNEGSIFRVYLPKPEEL